MKQTEIVIEMMKKNNGIVTSSQIDAIGMSRSVLRYLLSKGLIEKSERGVYILPAVWDDEIFNIHQRYRKGIYSLDTALFLNGLTDRTPRKYHMTFPSNYNISNVDKSRVIPNRVKMELYEVGKIELPTPGGNMVECYNCERTLCDILRSRNNTDIQLISEAFKKYIINKEKNIVLLSEYAKMTRVEAKLRSYLEALL